MARRPPTHPASLLRPFLLSQSHVASGGKEWDTVKPLACHFGGSDSLGRVVLIDNDAHKAMPDEAGNMILVPTWDGPPPQTAGGAGASTTPPTDPDRVLLHLADALLDPEKGLASPGLTDVRTRTAGIAARVAAAAAVEAARLGLAAPPRSAKPAQASLAPPAPTPGSIKPLESTSGGVAGTPGVATPPRESGLPDERSAWATAVTQAIHELGVSASASLASIFMYARFRAPGASVQVCLTKQSVKDAVTALRAGGEEAALVAASKPADAKVIAGKHLKACYSLGPGAAARMPTGGVVAAVEALRAAVTALGPKPGKGLPPRKRKKKGDGGPPSPGDAVHAAVEAVVLASVADLTEVRFLGCGLWRGGAPHCPAPLRTSCGASGALAGCLRRKGTLFSHSLSSLVHIKSPPGTPRAQHRHRPPAPAGPLRPPGLCQCGNGPEPAPEAAGRGEKRRKMGRVWLVA